MSDLFDFLLYMLSPITQQERDEFQHEHFPTQVDINADELEYAGLYNREISAACFHAGHSEYQDYYGNWRDLDDMGAIVNVHTPEIVDGEIVEDWGLLYGQ